MTMPTSQKKVDAGRIKGSIVIPTAVEVDLLWNLANGKTNMKCVMGGIVAGGFTATSAIAQTVFASITGSAAWTAYAAYVHTTASFAGVQLRDLRAANNPYVKSTGAAVAGTGAGTALSSSLAIPINLPTAFAGRGFRGRVYLPGLDSGADVSGTGLILAAAVTAAVNFVIQVQTSLTASGITLALKQPARQQYTGVTGAVHTARAAQITAVTTPQSRTAYFATQRRRSQP